MGYTTCKRQPSAAAVRPMFPVLFGISGCRRTKWKSGGRVGDACTRGGSALEFFFRQWPLEASALCAICAGLTDAEEAPDGADGDPEKI